MTQIYPADNDLSYLLILCSYQQNQEENFVLGIMEKNKTVNHLIFQPLGDPLTK